MPLYDYKCSVCRRGKTLFLKIAQLDEEQKCPNCGFAMNRQLSAPMVIGDYQGYSCPITGKWIEGRRAHEENLKRHDCRVFEPGETEAAKRWREKAEADFDAKIEATADELIYNLPAEKKEQLAQEIASGVQAEIIRN
jgi:putative FmdB family regulatory protein